MKSSRTGVLIDAGSGRFQGPPAQEATVKGDRVEVVIDAGGSTRTYEIDATRAGRRIDVRTGRGVVEVTEVTRGGTPVRTARFMASRVLALVEHPASRGARADDEQVAQLQVSA
jgi:hypothetical protein